jgi:hypothetical protein
VASKGLVRLHDRTDLPAVPAARAVRREDHRADLSGETESDMFYREVGQFKTTYKADQSIFPILQDKIGIASFC